MEKTCPVAGLGQIIGYFSCGHRVFTIFRISYTLTQGTQLGLIRPSFCRGSCSQWTPRGFFFSGWLLSSSSSPSLLWCHVHHRPLEISGFKIVTDKIRESWMRCSCLSWLHRNESWMDIFLCLMLKAFIARWTDMSPGIGWTSNTI